MKFLKIYHWAYKSQAHKHIYENLKRCLNNVILFSVLGLISLFFLPTGIDFPLFIIFSGIAIFNSYKLGVYQRLGEIHFIEDVGPEVEYIR